MVIKFSCNQLFAKVSCSIVVVSSEAEVNIVGYFVKDQGFVATNSKAPG